MKDGRTLAGAAVLGGGRAVPTACATALCGGHRNGKDEGGGGRGLRDSSAEAEAAANQPQARLQFSGAVVVSGGRRLTSACSRLSAVVAAHTVKCGGRRR